MTNDDKALMKEAASVIRSLARARQRDPETAVFVGGDKRWVCPYGLADALEKASRNRVQQTKDFRP